MYMDFLQKNVSSVGTGMILSCSPLCPQHLALRKHLKWWNNVWLPVLFYANISRGLQINVQEWWASPLLKPSLLEEVHNLQKQKKKTLNAWISEELAVSCYLFFTSWLYFEEGGDPMLGITPTVPLLLLIYAIFTLATFLLQLEVPSHGWYT